MWRSRQDISDRGISPCKGPGRGKSHAQVRIPGSLWWGGETATGRAGLWKPKWQARSLVFGFQAAGALEGSGREEVVTRPVSPDGSGPPRSTQFGAVSSGWKRNVLSVPHSFQPAVSPSLPTRTRIFPLPCSPPILGQPHHPLATHHLPESSLSHQALASRRGLSQIQTFLGAPSSHHPQPGKTSRTPRAVRGSSWRGA